MARAAGLEVGALVTAESLTKLLLHDAGLGKGAPPGARMAVLLNQADTDARKGAARSVACELLELKSPWERVVISHLLEDGPVEEIWIR